MADTPDNDSVETVNVQGNRISVSFSRKLSDGNYGGFEATAWVQGDIPTDANPQQTAEALAGLFQSAKAAVLDELGIGWSCDEQGIVRETTTPYVSAEHAAAAVQRVVGGTPQGDGGGSIKVMNAGQSDCSDEPLPQWLINECNKLGITAVWDKRLTKQGNQPWFQEAVPRGGTGHGKDKQGNPAAKGFWPPK